MKVSLSREALPRDYAFTRRSPEAGRASAQQAVSIAVAASGAARDRRYWAGGDAWQRRRRHPSLPPSVRPSFALWYSAEPSQPTPRLDGGVAWQQTRGAGPHHREPR